MAGNVTYRRVCSIFLMLTSKKEESIWHLPFQDEGLNINWNGNLDSSIGKSTRLVNWKSEVRIPVQDQIFLLKSKSDKICSVLSIRLSS